MVIHHVIHDSYSLLMIFFAQYSILNLKAVSCPTWSKIASQKIDLSTTRASQQTETSKDLHLPKLYPNQINPIIPSHPTMPRGYSLHLPWPVRTKKSAAVRIFQWAGLTFGELFPTRNTPGDWLVRTAKTERITNGAYFKGLPRNFLNSPEWRILRRPPNGCRCRWFWGITRVMWPNQATCTMYKMPILTTGLKATPLVLRNKMSFLLSCFLVGQRPIHVPYCSKCLTSTAIWSAFLKMVEVFVILTLQVLSMDTVQTNAPRITQTLL